ncbi:MAG TPA: hypothetical protein PKY35_08630 [Candidatus Hydrogenedentes bacterium]|nr:hypothetical protein [Candidatus Hydrogenedentota bacterium]HOL77081.1 hypothetical protein [Candidatus Hydrogenedentota bacterium]HPO87149.1 hypothetical protein [Candidatus Hydrogenedentota bacterium]
MKKAFVVIMLVVAGTCVSGYAAETASVEVGVYGQETRVFYGKSDGLPSEDVRAILVSADGTVYAGTSAGLAQWDRSQWNVVVDGADVYRLAKGAQGEVVFLERDGISTFVPATKKVERAHTPLPSELKTPSQVAFVLVADGIYLGTDLGVFYSGQKGTTPSLKEDLDGLPVGLRVRSAAIGANNVVAVAAEQGVFLRKGIGSTYQPLYPHDGKRSWMPRDARAVGFDGAGRLWLATPQGVACALGDTWQLFTGKEGLPYNDFTCLAIGPRNEVWFGTRIGAIRYDGSRWAYRQGKRWLPDDRVNDVAVASDGSAWFATPSGVGVIQFKPMTLADKAEFFENEIDKYHRRTEYGYVLGVSLPRPGDKSEWVQHDSDNDGLWTSMYGAGECFAYAATRDPKAKERAKKAFEALKFLGDVTQGGSNPAPKGFVARTVLPTSGPNPNETEYTPEKDREKQKRDAYWKIITPRWPTSADGKWYWKCDTSSDELDGHYFFYAQYYDLVADTDEEKARVREHVRALTDHLVEHNFCLVDHDGKPTRWAVFNPEALNGDPNWYPERGLNSLSILSYLAVAEHMTGDPKYRQAADKLIREHHYAQNVLVPKVHTGIGSGNQSDDEMAFMSYYNILKYEKDPKLHAIYAFSLYNYWRLEEPEANPFFNFVFAGSALNKEFADGWGVYQLTADPASWLKRSVDELLRFPLDRFDWAHKNSHRLDIIPLPKYNYFEVYAGEKPFGKGYRTDGYVIPVDERFYDHHNHDPWTLDVGGAGRELADGAAFLLPYYMGLYHGFIREKAQ